MLEASRAEKNFYGEDVKLHPITKMPIEQGIGARPVEEQVEFHLAHIEHHGGRHAAAAMRREMAATKEKAAADIALADIEHKD